jgi:hypothetical protein
MFKTFRSPSAATLALGALCLAAACSTPTKMTDVWRDQSYAGGPLKNLVVFGGRLNETNRRTLEDAFVSALGTHGVHATPSYQVFPSDLPDKNEAKATLQQAGFDGALVSALKAVNEKPTFVGGAGPGFWDGYYGPGWGGPAYAGGYVVTEQVVKFESSLWSLQGDSKLVWSATTQTDNPMTAKDFTTSLTNDVVPALTKVGLIGPAPGNAVSQAAR